MPYPTTFYPNAVQVAAPEIHQAPVIIGNAGGSLVLQAGVAFTQAGSSVTPGTPPAGASGNYTTAAGQPGYVNPQGLTVLDSGAIAGSLVAGPSTVASSTVETAIVTGPLPALDPQAKAVYYLKAAGVFSTTGSPTLTFTLRYGGPGGTQLAQIPATTAATSASGANFEAEGYVTVYSATSAAGTIKVGLGTSTVTDATSYFLNSATAPTAIVSSSAKNLVLDVAWGTSSASNTLTTFTSYAMRIA